MGLEVDASIVFVQITPMADTHPQHLADVITTKLYFIIHHTVSTKISWNAFRQYIPSVIPQIGKNDLWRKNAQKLKPQLKNRKQWEATAASSPWPRLDCLESIWDKCRLPNMLKRIFGSNKKVFFLACKNSLWGKSFGDFCFVFSLNEYPDFFTLRDLHNDM